MTDRGRAGSHRWVYSPASSLAQSPMRRWMSRAKCCGLVLQHTAATASFSGLVRASRRICRHSRHSATAARVAASSAGLRLPVAPLWTLLTRSRWVRLAVEQQQVGAPRQAAGCCSQAAQLQHIWILPAVQPGITSRSGYVDGITCCCTPSPATSPAAPAAWPVKCSLASQIDLKSMLEQRKSASPEENPSTPWTSLIGSLHSCVIQKVQQTQDISQVQTQLHDKIQQWHELLNNIMT